ncbi:DUF805 domain-containing protein [Arthrobacter sp. B2a2-09]|uniref:DUF805 domain-containing protein n=1 Tax=Arthrobacter sp. B2a2-09 TaxID=2952822 RepID=UPI0022CD7370|nr:DUF805 domain-containing protein [Arthrobacter sp. B2a2-09]MCZ9881086.1 DUF805 domain-containing protein [Arthrobacter sp. B2a2-09]
MSYENQAGQPYAGPTPPSYYAAPQAFSPRPRVGFVDAIKQFYSRYATFTGRSNRSEYWWVVLFIAIVNAILVIPYAIAVGSYAASISAADTLEAQQAAAANYPVAAGLFGILLLVWGLANIVPGLAVSVRRLHDGGFSGWFILLGLIPAVGGIILIFLYVMESKPDGERYGA